ncbi:MAG: protein-L-isoaspartate(D-aspartate) O-methyltransferase [Candidatus Bathyarchaeia archaeon]
MEKANWEKLIDNLVKQSIIRTPKIAQTMRLTPRSKFLPPDKQVYSNKDTPISIGYGQAVLAPHIVAVINENLKLAVGHKVLEVGSGSGWQAATMAELVTSPDVPRSEWGRIYTVEINVALAEQARKNIRNAGYSDRVTIINADGSTGYPEKAPYDRIVVSAASSEFPPPLLDQLKSGGIMIIPIGKNNLFQNLMCITKEIEGNIKKENLGGVAFASLTGKYGQKSEV